MSVALAVLVVDQITKLMVRTYIPQGANRPIIDGLISLTHVRNTGAAFGLFANAPAGPVRALLVVVSVLAVVLIWAYARDGWHDRSVVLAFGLILGGAIGNLLDRLYLHEVVDFIDVYWGAYHWPSFNVADMAITTGALTLFIGMARQGHVDEAPSAVADRAD
ncbi:MAG: signal peptidase II [Acidobacteriota bacterium]